MQHIHTEQAPEAIGPYSQAVKTESLLFCSGQIPLDPDTMEIIQGDIAQHTAQVFENLKAVIEAADCHLSDILKLTVYLTDLDNFSIVNEVMAKYFSEPFPARAAIGVASLPKGVGVEVDAVVAVRSS